MLLGLSVNRIDIKAMIAYYLNNYNQFKILNFYLSQIFFKFTHRNRHLLLNADSQIGQMVPLLSFREV